MEAFFWLLSLLSLYLVHGDPVVSVPFLKKLNKTRISADRLVPLEDGSASGSLELSEADCSTTTSNAFDQLELLAQRCTGRLVFENCCQPKFLRYGQLQPPIYPIRIPPMPRRRVQYAYCDLTSDGGGWMVILRRGFKPLNGEEWNRFERRYENGFGKLDKDFWMGLKAIRYLTRQNPVELMVELRKNTSGQEQSYFAHYNRFSLGSKSSGYALKVGDYDQMKSTLPDSLSHSNGFNFQAQDTWDL